MSSNIDLVIFGARGDLSKRKLFPALYQLDKAGLLADSVRVAGVAREDMDSVSFIQQTHDALKATVGEADWDEKVHAFRKVMPTDYRRVLEERRKKAAETPAATV